MELIFTLGGNCSIRGGGLSVVWCVNLLLVQLAQVDPTRDALRDQTMREGMSLLMMVSLLGVLVVTLLAVLITLRAKRRKKSRKPATPTDMSIDPWVEAGKRIDPPK